MKERDKLSPTILPRKLLIVWLTCLAPLLLVGLASSYLGMRSILTEILFREQDVAVAVTMSIFLFALRHLRHPQSFEKCAQACARHASPTLIAATASAFAAVLSFAGWFAVMRNFPLSMDEFMAAFDARIFREGKLFATVPAEWASVRESLQPMFTLFAADGRSWTSSYLPANAMLLALFDRLGAEGLAAVAWTTISIGATFGICQRLWPDRPDGKVVAVVLLATSAQFLMGAMTRYSMPAHLALNLAWLWLLLRDDRPSQAAAAVVAWVACGLHQIVFHPLFALPFVLELWLARRWKRAAFHTVAYAAIGVFWLSYWRIFMPAASEAAASERAATVWLLKVADSLDNIDAASFGLMAMNLARFITWQHPLTSVLAILAIGPALKLRGPLRAMALGMLLNLGMVAVIMPYQGHGWGYRYLHSFLGSICILAAFAWIRLRDRLDPAAAKAAVQGFALATAFTVLVLLPWRAVQVRGFVTPFAEAGTAIAAADGVDVVFVDTTGLFYAVDLVRNDPFLRNSPKVMDLLMMRESDIRTVCAQHRVAVFGLQSGSHLRPVSYDQRSLERLAGNRRLMRELGCGSARVVVR